MHSFWRHISQCNHSSGCPVYCSGEQMRFQMEMYHHVWDHFSALRGPQGSSTCTLRLVIDYGRAFIILTSLFRMRSPRSRMFITLSVTEACRFGWSQHGLTGKKQDNWASFQSDQKVWCHQWSVLLYWDKNIFKYACISLLFLSTWHRCQQSYFFSFFLGLIIQDLCIAMEMLRDLNA